MTNRRNSFSTVVLAAVLAIGTTYCTGCREEGPAEQAGEKIDDAVERMKDAVDPKGPAEKAGEKIDRALDR